MTLRMPCICTCAPIHLLICIATNMQAGLEVKSIKSMCSGAANDGEDDGDEDKGTADSVQIEQARLTGEAFKQDFSKKQCRRETNRAAAKQSRQRKKCHLETLLETSGASA